MVKVSANNLILTGLQQAQLSRNGEAYQRPVLNIGLADNGITLHDAIMLDEPNIEDKLDGVYNKWELAHGIRHLKLAVTQLCLLSISTHTVY